MHDPRVDKLAELLVNYSLEIQPGQTVMIQGEFGAEPLQSAIFAQCLQAGAYPFYTPYGPNRFEHIFRYAKPDMFPHLLKPYREIVKKVDARLYIYGELNTRSASEFDPEIVSKYYAEAGKVSGIMLERETKGEMKWVVSLFPTNAYAQEAGMSLTDYEDFVYRACMPDMDDPVGYWKSVDARQQKAVDWLKGKKEVHVTAPGTDLTLSIDGRPFINCACQNNVPDGEIFTSPIENSANGHVHFTYPTLYQGFEVDDVRIEFKDGKAVKATAGKNEAFLQKKLDTDAGARYLGEFAIGTNEGIDRFTGKILFDEKIGGSFHMALGRSYEESKGVNKSDIHWDMICDLRDGGQITVDGELFYKNGKFVIDF